MTASVGCGNNGEIDIWSQDDEDSEWVGLTVNLEDAKFIRDQLFSIIARMEILKEREDLIKAQQIIEVGHIPTMPLPDLRPDKSCEGCGD